MSPSSVQQPPASSFTLHTTLPLPAKIGQIDSIQILRAVAVFLVAWLHAGQTLGDWRPVELPHFTAFGIDIFFVISGFIMGAVLLRNQEAPGVRASWRFLRRRLIRILPIYWIFALLEYARLVFSRRSLASNYLPSLLLLPGLSPRYPLLIGVSWTLVFEMFFYYTLSAVLLLTVKRAVPVAILLLGLAVLAGEITHPRSALAIILTSPILLEFICGALVAMSFYRFGRRRRVGIVMLIVGVIISLYLRSHRELVGAQGIDLVFSSSGVMQRVMTWGLSATLIVSGTVFWSPATKSLPAKLAVVLGNSSYSAYLASSLLIEFSARVFMRLASPSLAVEVAVQLLIVLIVLFAGCVIYQFVEWPLIRWLQARI
jgi:exopolysaccharide production protein ExoZ